MILTSNITVYSNTIIGIGTIVNSNTTIGVDGSMWAWGPNNKKFYMGDLNQKSFMEVWHSEEFINLRKKHLLKDVSGSVCEHCIAFAGEECINP